MHIWDDPCTRNFDKLIESIKPRFKNRDITPEFIDDSGFNPCSFFGLKQRQCPIKLGKYSAPVNIAHKQYRRVHHLCKAHIYDVILFQVDLCRAPCPFYYDDIVLGCQLVVSLKYFRNQLFLISEIIDCAHICADFAIDNNLGSHICSGFKKNWIHED